MLYGSQYFKMYTEHRPLPYKFTILILDIQVGMIINKL